MVILGASAARISTVKVSVSVARVSSLTWTVKVKLPSVFRGSVDQARGRGEVEHLRARGDLPPTSLNVGTFNDDEQPVTVMKSVSSAPTWPVSDGSWGSIGSMVQIAA